jgi:carnitine O-acetyltransferase
MGIMGEHSVMDGTPTARMCDEVLNALHAPDFDHGEAATLGSKANTAVVPQALDWHVTPQTEQAIRRATGEARELIESQILGYCRTSYGKKVRPNPALIIYSECAAR